MAITMKGLKKLRDRSVPSLTELIDIIIQQHHALKEADYRPACECFYCTQIRNALALITEDESR